MIGHRPNWYWKIMWAAVSPLVLIFIFIFYIVNYIRGGTPTYQAWNKDLVKLVFFLSITDVLHIQSDCEVNVVVASFGLLTSSQLSSICL